MTATGPLRVLVVEDDEDLCAWYELLFAGTATVVLAHSLVEASERIGAGPVDVVLTDLHLGPWQCESPLDAMAREGSELPVVVVTGSTHGPAIDAACSRRHTVVLSKPAPGHEVLRAVRQVVAEAKGLPRAGASGAVRRPRGG